jgi:surfactin synthase thioesterase subunit
VPRAGETPDVVFLPGAGGAADFWRPVAAQIDRPADLVARDRPDQVAALIRTHLGHEVLRP